MKSRRKVAMALVLVVQMVLFFNISSISYAEEHSLGAVREEAMTKLETLIRKNAEYVMQACWPLEDQYESSQVLLTLTGEYASQDFRAGMPDEKSIELEEALAIASEHLTTKLGFDHDIEDYYEAVSYNAAKPEQPVYLVRYIPHTGKGLPEDTYKIIIDAYAGTVNDSHQSRK